MVSVSRRRALEATRTETLAALRAIAATLDRPLLATDVPEGLRFSVQRHFGPFDAARDAAGLPHPDLAYRWSAELVIAELRRLHAAKIRITDQALRTEHTGLLSAVRRFFSSIAAARRAARIPEPVPLTSKRQKWDDARVIAEIEELDRSGESLAYSKVSNALCKAATRRFGSWNEALEAAGFDPKQIRLVREAYTEGELIDTLRDLAITKPNLRFADLWECGFINALVRLFGDVETALAKAKLRDWPVREREQTMPKTDVLAAIRRRERAGQPTHRDAVFAEDHLLWHSGMVHFGSWLAAATAAGVDLADHNRRWSKESLLAALRERAREGKSLRPRDLRSDDNPLYASLRAYFGTYRAACRASRVSWR